MSLGTGQQTVINMISKNKILKTKSILSRIMIFVIVFTFTWFGAGFNVLALSKKDRERLYTPFYDEDSCGNSDSSIKVSGKLFVSGDSLTVGMRDSGGLDGKLSAQGWTVNGIEATTGITTSNALGVLDSEEAKNSDSFIIALGTNPENNYGAAVSNTINRIKQINSESKIYWVNLYTKKNSYDAANQTLSDLSSSLGFSIIDWKKEVTSNPGAYPFAGDGIHHTPTGYGAKADFVVRSVGNVTPVGDVSVDANSGDPLSTIFNFFVGKGLTDFQAAGIMGNIQHESGYEPQKAQGIYDRKVEAKDWRQAKGGGWGLVQWTPGSKMIDPTTAAGQDPNNIITQLEYLWGQLNNQWPEGWGGSAPSSGFNEKKAGDHLKSTTTVADATISFETKYERHAGPPQPKRIAEAERILQMARSGQIKTTAINSSANCDSLSLSIGAQNGSVVAKALEYAWPDHKGRGFTERKQEYINAIAKAKSEGRYVGGYNGVDCGGFVTTVMIDSGFEPRYNSGKGPTDTQKKWARENWQRIGNVQSSAELQPGDVAFSPGHTFMYVGKQDGFATEIASASLGSRAPMAGKENIIKDHNGVAVEWFRKK